MKMLKSHLAIFIALSVFVIFSSANNLTAAIQTTVSELAKNSDFHGIAVDPRDSSRIYLATHHGLFVVSNDGRAEQVSDVTADFMGFTPHPNNPDIFYASGHPATGGNLGFIASTDGGKSWEKLADGVGGPVDFHQMDVSKANPDVVIGVSRGLQMSRDGGRSWEMVGPTPEGTIDIAASATDENTIFAATQGGILRSMDGGQSWVLAHLLGRTATMIDAAADGRLYAFMIGTGLIRTTEPGLNWQLVSNDFGEQFILHLAVDPSDSQKMYAVAYNSQTRGLAIINSIDGGVTWKILGAE